MQHPPLDDRTATPSLILLTQSLKFQTFRQSVGLESFFRDHVVERVLVLREGGGPGTRRVRRCVRVEIVNRLGLDSPCIVQYVHVQDGAIGLKIAKKKILAAPRAISLCPSSREPQTSARVGKGGRSGCAFERRTICAEVQIKQGCKEHRCEWRVARSAEHPNLGASSPTGRSHRYTLTYSVNPITEIPNV